MFTLLQLERLADEVNRLTSRWTDAFMNLCSLEYRWIREAKNRSLWRRLEDSY